MEVTKTIKYTPETINRGDDLDAIDPDLIEFVNDSPAGISSNEFYWNKASKINLDRVADFDKKGIADLRLMNHFRGINDHIEKVGRALKNGQYFITCFESSRKRKEKIFQRYPVMVRHIIYLVDSLIHRFLPKLDSTSEYYYGWTSRPNRILSETECLGRIISCGFEIESRTETESGTIVIARKVSEPLYERQPHFSPVQSVRRIGRKKKRLSIRTFRTSYPYSEFLNIAGTEKEILTPRHSRLGQWLIKYRFHHIPAIRNVFNGDMKLVGVKPLTRQEYKKHPAWLQNERSKFKPGLIQPHLADLPESDIEFFTSEANYIAAYRQNPFRTDFRYLMKAFYNIYIKRVPRVK